MANNTSLALSQLGTHMLSSSAVSIKFFSFIAVGVFIVAINAVVIYIVLSKPNMKTIINIMFASLAVSDLIMGAINFPFMAIYTSKPGGWPLGRVPCAIWNIFDGGCGNVSLYTFLLIALYRLKSIVAPYQELNKHHQTLMKLGLVVAWVVPLTFWTAYYVVVSLSEPNEQYCWNYNSRLFVMLCSTFIYCLPVVIVLVIVIATKLVIWKKNNEKGPMVLHTKKDAPRQKREKKANRVLFVTTGTFFVCWAPMAIVWMIYYDQQNFPVIYGVAYGLYYLDSAFNPILLFIFNEGFRTSLKEIVCRHNDVHPRPSTNVQRVATVR